MTGIDCARYVGLITRLMPSAVSLDGAEVYMVSECGRGFPVGEYLVVESPEARYLARVRESRVEDVYSIAKTPVLSLQQELAMGVKYVPRFVRLELVSECSASCAPPSTPPAIHSRVRTPEPGEVAAMLSLPQSGIPLGVLAMPSGAEVAGNAVLLPHDALRHHVLVVGTTGSGKTTLLKNLALELLGGGKATVVALDSVGHFHHLVFNGVRARVVVPATRRDLPRHGGGARAFARRLARRYLRDAFASFGVEVRRFRCRYGYVRRGGDAVVRRISVSVEFAKPQASAELELVPWALATRGVLRRVHELTGMLTEQARMFYGRIIEEVERRLGGRPTFREMFQFLTGPSEVQAGGRPLLNYEAISRSLGIHVSTLENIVRAILAVEESGVVDVSGGGVAVAEPNYGELFRPGYVAVHLAGAPPMVQRMAVYRLLEGVYRVMGREHLRDRERTAAVLIDEAHLFFPQARTEDEKAAIEAHLTRLTRLGRGRGIGVVFATHMPDDLNDAVMQLANTKIVLRSEERVLERLGVPPQERRFLAAAPAGLAYVKSFALRHPVYVRIAPRSFHLG
jgi:DNA helicase HerA-like ATPase